MTSRVVKRRQRKYRRMARRLLGTALFAVILAGFVWSNLPTAVEEVAQSVPLAFEDDYSIVELADEAPDAVVAVDDAAADPSTAPVSLLFDAPQYATTLPPTEIATAPLPDSGVPMPAFDAPNSPMPMVGGPATPSFGPMPNARPPRIGATPPGGFGGPRPSSPPAASAPPVGGAPGGSGPILAGPVEPAAGPEPVDLPAQLDDPVVVANTDPEDGWFSPGHSPGITEVTGDFALDGGTLLFEIMGTQAGTEHDQLQVSGAVNLDDGIVVFAFINDFMPSDLDLFELILASSIDVDFSEVDFYYGFFDDTYPLHAPQNLSFYNIWDPASGVAMLVGDTVEDSPFAEFFGIQYLDSEADADFVPEQGPDTPITPLAIPVPTPAPLLLLAIGLLLTAAFRRGNRRA